MSVIYTELTKKAMCVAYNAHRNQVDGGGVPAVFHPLHVAEQMADEIETAAALLHDVVEDTAMTLEDLGRAGFPPAVLEAVRLLTRDRSLPYPAYIRALKANPTARRVKIAELLHNSDRTRLAALDSRAIARLDRCAEGLRLLEED